MLNLLPSILDFFYPCEKKKRYIYIHTTEIRKETSLHVAYVASKMVHICIIPVFEINKQYKKIPAKN